MAESSLKQYAEHFWKREKLKFGGGTVSVEVGEFERGGDPVTLLTKWHPDKLPFERASGIHVELHELSLADLETLTIHTRIVDDSWMLVRGLVPSPPTCLLKDLAAHFRFVGFFERNDELARDTGQWKHYRRWAEKPKDNALRRALNQDSPMIQVNEGTAMEIVDGWGRLLPLLALVQEGFTFDPFPSYVATTAT
jgi:hypothetical protein